MGKPVPQYMGKRVGHTTAVQPVRLAYQPLASSTFLSEQINH
jgi:hypothetical protein